MWSAKAAIAASIVVAFAVAPAWAEEQRGQQFAYFHTTNIFKTGLRGSQVIALTFDDGPSPHTPKILEALRRYNVPATFFIVGNMAKLYPDVLWEIAADGHLLANHSGSHKSLSRKRYGNNPELLIKELREVHDYIAPYMLPGDTLFFRAPYGAWRAARADTLNADPVLKHYIGPVFWDVGGATYVDDGWVIASADWDCWHRGWKAQTCAKGYLREIDRKGGGVVLMHSLVPRSAQLVDEVVPVLLEQGYHFVRLDQVHEFDRYRTPIEPSEPVIAMRGGQ
ncbi:MAG: polysaccharide deacetylase family protein [Alphaproteobacteria bacterium]